MDESLVLQYISSKRIDSYGSLGLYKKNLKKSKSNYIPLSILEISLRNSINNHFEKLYTKGWLINEAQFLQRKELEKIHEAKLNIKKKEERLTKEKLLAELTFGFWTGLFQSSYKEKMRLGNLKQIFSNLPPKDVLIIDRKLISSKLNHIRKFRNRVFHHENVIKDEFQNIEQDIEEILKYFHRDICEFSLMLNNE